MAVYLLSIKPRFAEQIYKGVKKYELRRKVGSLKPNSYIIIYESAPIKAVTGVVKVGNIRVLSPGEVEALVLAGKLEGCDEEDLKYVIGCRPVLVIEIVEHMKLKRALKLEELRTIVDGFKPPLSYIRVDGKERYIKLIEEVFRLIE